MHRPAARSRSRYQRQMWPRVVALRSDTCEETLPSSSSSRAFFHLPSLATSLLLFIPITTPPNTLAASRSLTIDGREGGASTQRKQTTVYLFIHLSIHLSIRKKLYRLGLRCGSVFDSITRGDTDERKREREVIVIIDHQRDIYIYLSVFRYDWDEIKSEGSSIVGRRVSIMDGRGS